jgi:predicted kinase
MQKVILTRGIPGSGKSTWAKKWVEESPSTRIRVNRDDIRNMLGPYWIPDRERLVTSLEYQAVTVALAYNYSVVLDATNFKNEQKWQKIVDAYNVSIEIQDFTDVPLELCIERDSKRENPVGAEVITKFYNQNIK